MTLPGLCWALIGPPRGKLDHSGSETPTMKEQPVGDQGGLFREVDSKKPGEQHSREEVAQINSLGKSSVRVRSACWRQFWGSNGSRN